jgi:uncharacterized damage-inducible protein DinB
MKLSAILCITLLAGATSALAQENPYLAPAKQTFGMIKGNIIKAAEQMPVEHYTFKPTADVRSFGELVGHVANANYMICSRASGAESPNKVNIEKTVTDKAALGTALAESFAYCDAQFDALGAKAPEVIDLFGMKMPRLNVLQFNTIHDMEHYGNMVTYMRIKGLVPPSSQR